MKRKSHEHQRELALSGAAQGPGGEPLTQRHHHKKAHKKVDHFGTLPDSVLCCIFSCVANDSSLLSLRRVCRRFRDVVEGSLVELWRHFDLPQATRAADGAGRARRALQAVEAARRAAGLASADLPPDPDWLAAAFLSARTWPELTRLRMAVDGSSALDLALAQCPRLRSLHLTTRAGLREDVELDSRLAALAPLADLALDGEFSLQAGDLGALLRAAPGLRSLCLHGLVLWEAAGPGLNTLAAPLSLAALGPLPFASTLEELRISFDTARQGEQWLALEPGTLGVLGAMPRLRRLAIAGAEGAGDGAWGLPPPGSFPALARLEVRTRGAREALDGAWLKALLRGRGGALRGVALVASNVDGEALGLLAGAALEELELGASPHVDDAAVSLLLLGVPALRTLLLLGVPARPGGPWLGLLADRCPRLARLEVRPAWREADPLAARAPEEAISRLRSRGVAVSLLPSL
eukprot:tig00020961_g16728.t1